MAEPNKEQIERLKAQHSDRSLHLVTVTDDGEEYHFVMTGPSKLEYKKFMDELLSAKDKKNDAEMVETVHKAVECAALAQIRWPERLEVQALFDRKPALADSFRDEIHKAAGANAEARSKKL